MFYARALKQEKDEPRLTPPTESHVGQGFVSVVVPAYNEGDGIKLTLATIDELAQVRPMVLCCVFAALPATACLGLTLVLLVSCLPRHAVSVSASVCFVTYSSYFVL